MVRRRSDALELAILGLLHEAPLHGYELRKRLAAVLGPFRAISYGSLYPALKDMLAGGLITDSEPAPRVTRREARVPKAKAASMPAPLATKRARIVYRITGDGHERLSELLSGSGPESWDDEAFATRFAFFGRTPAETRLRILEGRRARLQERLAMVRDSLARARDRSDSYALRLQEHGLEGVEREMRWLDDLISFERGQQARP